MRRSRSSASIDTNEAQIFLRRTVALLEQMKVHRDALAEEMTFGASRKPEKGRSAARDFGA